MNKPVILLSSNEPWGNMRYSKHHYALELAKHTKVFFLNPAKKWSLKCLTSNTLNTTPVTNNLTVVDYQNPLPGKRSNENNNQVIQHLEALIGDRNIIFWQFDVFRFVNIKFNKSTFWVFHVVDEYKHLSTNLSIAANSDLIICVAESFLKTYEKCNTPTISIPHGIAEQATALPEKIKELKDKFGDYFLWCGTFSPRVDYNLLINIATTYPKNNLLLIGKFPETMPDEMGKKIKKLRKLSNVILLPPQEPEIYNTYISASNVCLIAYKTDKNTLGTTHSSLKFNQYITHTKPIISTLLNEYTPYSNDLLLIADSPEKFMEHIDKVIKREWVPNTNKIKEYINKHNYSELLAKIMAHVPEQFQINFVK